MLKFLKEIESNNDIKITGISNIFYSFNYMINPYITELFNLNFQSLEVVSRYRDPQIKVTENLCYLWNDRIGANENIECLL